MAFSPDGRCALSGGTYATDISGMPDATLRLWDVETGKVVRSFDGHTDVVRSVAFSPDGRRALSGSRDMTMRLWRLPD